MFQMTRCFRLIFIFTSVCVMCVKAHFLTFSPTAHATLRQRQRCLTWPPTENASHPIRLKITAMWRWETTMHARLEMYVCWPQRVVEWYWKKCAMFRISDWIWYRSDGSMIKVTMATSKITLENSARETKHIICDACTTEPEQGERGCWYN